MGKLLNYASGSSRLHDHIEGLIKAGDKSVEGVTVEDLNGAWEAIEPAMNFAFKNGIKVTASAVTGVIIGAVSVKIYRVIKAKKKKQEETKESEEEAE